MLQWSSCISRGQLEVPRHSSCGDFNLQAMMHIESSWINWIQYQFLPLANLGESKVKLYKMGEFCCNIVANFVKGSAAKWRFQRFDHGELIQVDPSELDCLFLFQLDWNHLLPPKGHWILCWECLENEARNRRSLWRTSCRLISEQRQDMLLAIENRPLEKIRKGDPYWKPLILLSMLVFGVYQHFGRNHDIALRCYCNLTPSHCSLTFLVLWQSWRICLYDPVWLYVTGQECLRTRAS